jgi:hypothetical protein
MEIRMRNTGQIMTSEEFNRTICTLPITTEVLNQHNADPVLEGPQPTPSRYQIVARDGVTNVNGEWFSFYKLVDLDAEGIASFDAQKASSARQARDVELEQSDWTQLADSPVDKAAWATYRQALRDLPTATGFPWDMTWPTEPGATNGN